MPIRTAYAKKLHEKRKQTPEPTVVRRRPRQNKDTRWMIMINGKQVGDIKSTTSECYVYIEEHNLSDKLPEIKRIN